MFEHERTLYAFVLHYTRLLTADIPEERMRDQPIPGVNPPLWVLGHLAIATDFAGKPFGLPALCPQAWHVHFGPGSDPLNPPDPVPTKAELLAVLEAGHARVTEATRSASAEAMARPHGLPIRFLAEHVPTTGDLIAHLMTTHAAVHLGQLSAWRRLIGLPSVLSM